MKIMVKLFQDGYSCAMTDVDVKESYTRCYETPIFGKLGDCLKVCRRDDEEPGWVWCQHPDTRLAGWVPECFLEFDQDRVQAVLRRDYNAMELTVDSGQTLQLIETVSGWSWCCSADGNAGWVPHHHLAMR